MGDCLSRRELVECPKCRGDGYIDIKAGKMCDVCGGGGMTELKGYYWICGICKKSYPVENLTRGVEGSAYAEMRLKRIDSVNYELYYVCEKCYNKILRM